MLQLVRPKHFIPIHGELRHLKQHAILAEEIGFDSNKIAVIENGTAIEFQDGKMQIGERFPGRYVFVDGSGVGDIGPSVLRERESLARDGFVLIHLQLDSDSGKLVGNPEIISRGFVFVRDSEELFEQAKNRIRSVAKSQQGKQLKTLMEKDLAKFFYSETKRKPMVFVFTSNGKLK